MWNGHSCPSPLKRFRLRYRASSYGANRVGERHRRKVWPNCSPSSTVARAGSGLVLKFACPRPGLRASPRSIDPTHPDEIGQPPAIAGKIGNREKLALGSSHFAGRNSIFTSALAGLKSKSAVTNTPSGVPAASSTPKAPTYGIRLFSLIRAAPTARSASAATT